MRSLIKTPEYAEFIATVGPKVLTKVDYVTDILIQSDVLNAKFFKKLENTEFYEMRLSVDKEYRIIMYSIDHPNIIEAQQILLLNGFIKKSTKDYASQIEKANKIIQRLTEEAEIEQTVALGNETED